MSVLTNAPDVLKEVKKLVIKPFYFDLKEQSYMPIIVKWKNPNAPWIGNVDLEIYLDYKNRRFVINDFTSKFDDGAIFIGEIPIKAIQKVSDNITYLPIWEDYEFKFEIPE
jgi:hypothetical protein